MHTRTHTAAHRAKPKLKLVRLRVRSDRRIFAWSSASVLLPRSRRALGELAARSPSPKRPERRDRGGLGVRRFSRRCRRRARPFAPSVARSLLLFLRLFCRHFYGHDTSGGRHDDGAFLASTRICGSSESDRLPSNFVLLVSFFSEATHQHHRGSVTDGPLDMRVPLFFPRSTGSSCVYTRLVDVFRGFLLIFVNTLANLLPAMLRVCGGGRAGLRPIDRVEVIAGGRASSCS